MLSFDPADIAACYGADWTSRAISLGTVSCLGPRELRWPPSHVAILCRHQGQPVWIESTSLCAHPCLISGEHTVGVQAQQPADRVADYVHRGGRVDLYRCTGMNRLSASESRLLSWLLVDRIVRGHIAYDLGGALLSGTRVFQCLRMFPGADLRTLFCSELIAAVLMRLGRMNHANPTRFNPGRLLRTLVVTGKYVRCHSYHAGQAAGGDSR